MSEKKDFLSQFSTNNKPDSFKEEERTPVANNGGGFKITPKMIIIGVIVLVVIGLVVFFIFFMPKIDVEDFTGKPKEDAMAWIKQQEIETSGIIFKEDYNFDLDEGLIISQTPVKGKVSNKAKITFIVSAGADPSEKIKVPDIKSMEKNEINTWISTNKLLGTKLNSVYDETVPVNSVIKVEYSGCEEENFTRACSLKITISKGPKPQEEITMPNFVKKTYAELELWASSRKIKLEKRETYSDTEAVGVIISQSVKENEKIKSGDTLIVTVSLGKGVTVPNFSKMTETEINTWLTENSAFVKVIKKHFDSDDFIISQSHKAGANIGVDNKMQITINLGKNFYLDELGFTIIGNSYDKFKDNTYRWVEDLGVNIDTHKNFVSSSEPYGTILGIDRIFNGATEYSSVQRLPLEVEITCKVSDGTGGSKQTFEFNIDDYKNQPLGKLLSFINSNQSYGLKLMPEVIPEEINKTVTSIKYNDGTVEHSSGTVYLPYNAILDIELSS